MRHSNLPRSAQITQHSIRYTIIMPEKNEQLWHLIICWLAAFCELSHRKSTNCKFPSNCCYLLRLCSYDCLFVIYQIVKRSSQLINTWGNVICDLSILWAPQWLIRSLPSFVCHYPHFSYINANFLCSFKSNSIWPFVGSGEEIF